LRGVGGDSRSDDRADARQREGQLVCVVLYQLAVK
jgi:hypothetical protein